MLFRSAKLHLVLPITDITAWTIPPHPCFRSVEKLSSTKLVPGARKVGDRWSNLLGRQPYLICLLLKKPPKEELPQHPGCMRMALSNSSSQREAPSCNLEGFLSSLSERAPTYLTMFKKPVTFSFSSLSTFVAFGFLSFLLMHKSPDHSLTLIPPHPSSDLIILLPRSMQARAGGGWFHGKPATSVPWAP